MPTLEGLTRREFLHGALATGILVGTGLLGLPEPAEALEINWALKRINFRRPVRKRTNYIILHTTEATGRNVVPRIARLGLANFCVKENGKVYGTIEDRRLAKHAGRSMWNGTANLDRYSVGIEVEGFHSREPTRSQIRSLRDLLSELQPQYGIRDDQVMPHSMVAYGAPNRWHRGSHRGRKRCGMLFARPPLRERLGLGPGPAYDPDVRAGRLAVADPYLASVLFGKQTPQEPDVDVALNELSGPGSDVISARRSAWFIAREKYDDPETRYEFPDGRTFRGNEIPDWEAIPAGTKVIVGGGQKEEAFEGFREIPKDGATPWRIAGREHNRASTVYFLPDGRVRTGAQLSRDVLDHIPPGTKMLVGYVYGGHVTKERTPIEIAGEDWNLPSTYYVLPGGRVLAGDDILPRKLPPRTLVLFRD